MRPGHYHLPNAQYSVYSAADLDFAALLGHRRHHVRRPHSRRRRRDHRYLLRATGDQADERGGGASQLLIYNSSFIAHQFSLILGFRLS